MNYSTRQHHQCQSKDWLLPQYHDEKRQRIKRPDEIEGEIPDPPSITDASLFDRIRGSMVGMALGDALGAHVEFRPPEYLLVNPVTDLEGGGTWGLEKGQFTDDTSMALCLATSLIRHGDFNPYDQLVRYKWWYQNGYLSSTGKCFDIGMATADSLSEFHQRQKAFAERHQIPLDQIDQLSDPQLLQKFNVFCSGPDVAGNGALMRLAPVPLFFHQQPAVAVERSGVSGRITHGDRKAYDACRYYGALIVAALHGESKASLLSDSFYADHQSWFGGRPLHESVALVSRGSFKRQSGIRGKGYIVSALEAALWAFWSDDNSFEKGALAAVNLGDDTDTTAAIYGQLAGAFYSYANLPTKWLDHLYARKFLESISGWLLFEGNRWNAEQIKSKL